MTTGQLIDAILHRQLLLGAAQLEGLTFGRLVIIATFTDRTEHFRHEITVSEPMVHQNESKPMNLAAIMLADAERALAALAKGETTCPTPPIHSCGVKTRLSPRGSLRKARPEAGTRQRACPSVNVSTVPSL